MADESFETLFATTNDTGAPATSRPKISGGPRDGSVTWQTRISQPWSDRFDKLIRNKAVDCDSRSQLVREGLELWCERYLETAENGDMEIGEALKMEWAVAAIEERDRAHKAVAAFISTVEEKLRQARNDGHDVLLRELLMDALEGRAGLTEFWREKLNRVLYEYRRELPEGWDE